MWALLDLIARLICVGGFVLVGYFVYQITRENSAPACMSCGVSLVSGEIVSCVDCLGGSNV